MSTNWIRIPRRLSVLVQLQLGTTKKRLSATSEDQEVYDLKNEVEICKNTNIASTCKKAVNLQ